VSKSIVNVGRAEFEIRSEHGLFVIYAGGYGRPMKRIGTCDGPVQASVGRSLLARGAADEKTEPRKPARRAQDDEDAPPGAFV
jgi:hypothetical protein